MGEIGTGIEIEIGTGTETGIETEIVIEIGTATEIAIGKDDALVPRIGDVVRDQETGIGTAENVRGQETAKGVEAVTGIAIGIRKKKRLKETMIKKKEVLNKKQTNHHQKRVSTLKPKIWTFQILLKIHQFSWQ